jgi:hypothetical protein
MRTPSAATNKRIRLLVKLVNGRLRSRFSMSMSGLPAIKIDQTEISPISVPVEGNELNYL